MSDSATISARLRHVHAIQADAPGATISFAEGEVGRLPNVHVSFDRALRLLRDSLERQTPVGVRLDSDGTIQGVYWVDSDAPLKIDEKDKDIIRIFFPLHAGLYHLRRDHPDCPRLLALLHQARQEQTRLWFLTDLPRLDVVDLQPVDSTKPSPNGASTVGAEAGSFRDTLSPDAPS